MSPTTTQGLRPPAKWEQFSQPPPCIPLSRPQVLEAPQPENGQALTSLLPGYQASHQLDERGQGSPGSAPQGVHGLAHVRWRSKSRIGTSEAQLQTASSVAALGTWPQVGCPQPSAAATLAGKWRGRASRAGRRHWGPGWGVSREAQPVTRMSVVLRCPEARTVDRSQSLHTLPVQPGL